MQPAQCNGTLVGSWNNVLKSLAVFSPCGLIVPNMLAFASIAGNCLRKLSFFNGLLIQINTNKTIQGKAQTKSKCIWNLKIIVFLFMIASLKLIRSYFTYNSPAPQDIAVCTQNYISSQSSSAELDKKLFNSKFWTIGMKI